MNGFVALRGFTLVCLGGFLAASPAQAASWADALFPVKQHAFGTVAVGAKTTFRFPIENRSGRDIHIARVRASCGCTTPTIETPWVGAGQRGSILATFNTDTFRGKKGATLTVVLDQPTYAEVRLRVDGFIRRDVVFHPGVVDFGKLAQGDTASQTVQIAYAGRDGWQIMKIERSIPSLQTELRQTVRSGQRVTYDLQVTLDETAPAGFLQQELVLITNDRSMPRIPLRVQGRVEAGLTVSPAAIAAGSLRSGETISQRLVIRGAEPFQIADIHCEGWEIAFERPEAAKTTHLLAIEMTPQAAGGEFRGPLTITTTGGTTLQARALLTAEIRPERGE